MRQPASKKQQPEPRVVASSSRARPCSFFLPATPASRPCPDEAKHDRERYLPPAGHSSISCSSQASAARHAGGAKQHCSPKQRDALLPKKKPRRSGAKSNGRKYPNGGMVLLHESQS